MFKLNNPFMQLSNKVKLYLDIKNKYLVVLGRLGYILFSLNNRSVKLNYLKGTTVQLFIEKSFIRTFFSKLRSMIFGVTYGYSYNFEFKGVGYKAIRKKFTKNKLYIFFYSGASHSLIYKCPIGIFVKIRKKNIKEGRFRRLPFKLYSVNFNLLNNTALNLQNFRLLNIYKPRGIVWLNMPVITKKPVLSHWQRINRY